MEGEEAERADLCQGVSPNDEPCGRPATVHCTTCGRWFCDAHAEGEGQFPQLGRVGLFVHFTKQESQTLIPFFNVKSTLRFGSISAPHFPQRSLFDSDTNIT